MGTNDIDQMTPGKFATEYKTLVEQIHTTFEGPKVLASCVLPRPRDNETTAGQVLTFNKVLQQSEDVQNLQEPYMWEQMIFET